jgi:WD40 repeat protein
MVGVPVVPLRDRVVEIEAVLGTGPAEQYRYGSGFRLGRRLVLTAAHVVAGAATAGITVRGPDKVPHPARVVDGLAGDPDTVDLALLELRDEIAELPPPPVAAVDRDAPVPVPVEGCWAVGYPLFQEIRSAAGVVRETAQVWGMILPAENLVGGLLSLHVTSAPRALPPRQEALGQSQWSGMSGAAVLAGEQLIGVVSEHAPRRGESTITVTPLASLDRLPAAAAARWWAHLAADPEQLIKLPVSPGRAEPAYRATLRQLRARTGMLQDRDGELRKIGAFAIGQPAVTGPTGALAPPGSQHAWLVGGPWAGKTALLAEAVHALPPEVDCVAYFLTRPPGDANRERFLAAVVPQLAWLIDEDPPSAPDEHVFRQLWEQAAQRAADQGRQLLLIVDGLDEDLRPGGHSVAGWLPGRLPGLPARVLVASRLHPRLPDDVDPVHPLAAFTPDKVYMLPDSPHAARLRELADQEITQLLRRASDDLALDVLGLLTAARGGPLAAADLATLTGSRPWKIREILDGEAARILQEVASADTPRYTFAHETLLARCQEQGVGDPSHTCRIEEWAATWRDRRWPVAHDVKQGTPQYLLDRYPQTLYNDPPRLAALVGDVGWVTAAIQTLGVDAVLAELKTAGAAAPRELRLAAMYAVVQGQAHHLRDRETVGDLGFVPRQLCLQAAELGETLLAADFRTLLLTSDDPGPVLQWTTERVSPALALELGRHDGRVTAAAVLPDGRVVTGGDDERVLVWDPDEPGAGPAELGRHRGYSVTAAAVLPDGRVVTGIGDILGEGELLVWDPDEPGARPVVLGGYDGRVEAVAVLPDGWVFTGMSGIDFDGDGVILVWHAEAPGAGPGVLGGYDGQSEAVAVLPDGRLVACIDSVGDGGRVLVWGPGEPGAGPVVLGRHDGRVSAMAVLPDGRVVTGISGTGGGPGEGRMLVWHPDEPGARPVVLGGHDGRVEAAAVLADGRVVTGISRIGRGPGGGRVLVWDPDAPGADPVELGSHGQSVTAAAVLADGRMVTGGNDGGVLVWDPDEPGAGPVAPGSHDGRVSAMALLPDGRVVTVGDDQRVLVWDPDESGIGPVELGRPRLSVSALAVLPDGRAVTGGGFGRIFGGGQVLVWDPAEPGTGPVELGSNESGVRAMAVLLDGRVVTGGADRGDGGGVLVWDPNEPGVGPVELGRHGQPVTAVAVLPDGRLVTGISDSDRGTRPRRGNGGRMLVWDPEEPGVGPVVLGGYDGWVRAVAVLADGRVVTGGDDGRVLVWDPTQPGVGPVELGRHGQSATAVAVLPDGRVVTSGADRRVRLWDVESSSACGLLACSAYALATSLSPSGARLFIGHASGGISCWEVRAATTTSPEPRNVPG